MTGQSGEWAISHIYFLAAEMICISFLCVKISQGLHIKVNILTWQKGVFCWSGPLKMKVGRMWPTV